MYGLNSLPILIINFRALVRIMWIYKVFMNTLEAFKQEYKISHPKSYSNQNASIAVLFPARWYFSHALCPTTHHPDEYVYYILQIQHIIFYPINAGYVKGILFIKSILNKRCPTSWLYPLFEISWLTSKIIKVIFFNFSIRAHVYLFFTKGVEEIVQNGSFIKHTDV